MAKLDMSFVESVAKQLRESATKGGGSGYSGAPLPELKFYKWKDGINMLRILEPWMEDGKFALLFYTHFQVPPDRGYHPCVELTWPQAKLACPICEVIREASKRNLFELVKRYTPGGYAYVNAVDLYEMDKGVQIVDLRMGMYNRCMELMTMRDPQPPHGPLYGDITDMETGYSVIIKKAYKGSGENQKTEYTTDLHPKQSPAHPDPDIRAKWLAARYAIEKIKKMPNEEGLKAIAVAGQQFRAWVASRMTAEPVPLADSSAGSNVQVVVEPATKASPPVEVHPDVLAMQAAAKTPDPGAVTKAVAPETVRTTVEEPKTIAPIGEPKKRSKPSCYEIDWREGALQPAKCLPCPWEVPCSASVQRAIKEGKIVL